MIVIKFDWKLGASHVDLISRSVMFFSFLQSSCWDKDEEFKYKKGICIWCEIFMLRASAATNQKYTEKVGL